MMRFLLCFNLTALLAVMILFMTFSHSEGKQGYSNETTRVYHAVIRRAILDDQYQVIANSNINNKASMIQTSSNNYNYSNPIFVFFNNESGMVSFGLSSFWNDELKSCDISFKCTANFSTGWKNDSLSFQISTQNNTNQTWSSIYGQSIEVKPKERYQMVTHMKLNEWATQSHVVLEGFNETAKEWYQIKQCPSGTDGPLEWQESSCIVVIPQNTTEMRPVLNAGWSSQPNQEAATWFDSIYLTKLGESIISNPNVKTELLYEGLDLPTNMAFLGPNDILVLEKNKGTVQRIVNGVKSAEPLLDVPVATDIERGMLGIAIQKNASTTNSTFGKESIYVFLYFTEADKDNGTALGNRVYRYQFVDDKLINPKLLLDLPVGLYHNGGQILIGPDEYLYITTGELDNSTSNSHRINEALNVQEFQGKAAYSPDGRGGILRIDQNGAPIITDDDHGILGDEDPLDEYYAYGVRNSFGLDFDPLTGRLWDTENGPEFGDEINLIEPGFNSGWNKVQGIWNVDKASKKISLASENPDNLVDFGGKGKYSPPEFTWNKPVGPTTLVFLSTDKLGKQYENDMFVGDVNNGRIYHFKLDKDRTALLLKGPLADKVADNDDELDEAIFPVEFGDAITDLELGPDGYLYIISHYNGKIYRVVPSETIQDIINYLDEVSPKCCS